MSDNFMDMDETINFQNFNEPDVQSNVETAVKKTSISSNNSKGSAPVSYSENDLNEMLNYSNNILETSFKREDVFKPTKRDMTIKFIQMNDARLSEFAREKNYTPVKLAKHINQDIALKVTSKLLIENLSYFSNYNAKHTKKTNKKNSLKQHVENEHKTQTNMDI